MTDNERINGVNGAPESSSPSRCSVGEQRGPGRHHATARTRRRKWTLDDNRRVMGRYYESNPSRNGYRRRMHELWISHGNFYVTEQRLVHQANQIRKRKWLSDLELEEIRRNIEDSVSGQRLSESCETSDEVEGESAEDVEECISENTEQPGIELRLIDGCEISAEEMTIISRLEEILKEERKRLPSLKERAKRKLKAVVEKVDSILGKIITDDITTTNDLIYAGAVLVNELTERTTSKKMGEEPWWKRRLEKQVKELQRDLGRVDALIKNKTLKKKFLDHLQKKYRIRQKGPTTVREEIQQRIVAKIGKIKRYTNRVAQFKQNRGFENNQKKFYQQVDGNRDRASDEVPDEGQTNDFWNKIWGKEGSFNENAEWYLRFKNEQVSSESQEPLIFTEDKIRERLLRVSNWKATGPDLVQGYWLKNFKSLHKRLAENLQDVLANGNVPEWMTKGRTVLIQKYMNSGKDPSNY